MPSPQKEFPCYKLKTVLLLISPGWHYKTGCGWMVSMYMLDAETGGVDGKSSHSSWLPLNLKKLSIGAYILIFAFPHKHLEKMIVQTAPG